MDYVYAVAVLMALFVILATSFNFIMGYGGLISIAHPVFYAIGAYSSALLARDMGVPVFLAIPAGGLIALIASVAVALPSLRISGDYLLIASIGFQLGILELIKNLPWTGGSGADQHPFVSDPDRRTRGLCGLRHRRRHRFGAAAPLDRARSIRPGNERDARRRACLRRART